MKIRQKRFFTLLEILIALSLSLIIMGVLLSYYFQMSRVNILSDQAAIKAFEMRTVQNRLQDMVRRILPPKEKRFFFTGGNDPALFLTGTSNLIFSYDNGIVFDEALSNETLGRLFVDPENNLTLMTWVKRDKWEDNVIPRFHSEVLLTGVTGFVIKFFAAYQDNPDLPELSLGNWPDHWQREYQQLPALIQFVITKDGKEEVYAFPIIGAQTKVVYKS